MRISFWIPAIVFYYAVRIVLSNCIQVGTVLFTTTDLVKRCWSESEKALLRARLIMQDVLPDPDYIDFSKPDMVLTLLDYFQSCYDIIGVSTYGNVQKLMYLALSDALGGYLRGYALPLTKRAFYEGHVKYSEARSMFRLYDDIRAFLKTNGIGWAKPMKLCKSNARIKPLVIGNGGCETACDQLYIIGKKSGSRNCCILNLKTEKFVNENFGGALRHMESKFREGDRTLNDKKEWMDANGTEETENFTQIQNDRMTQLVSTDDEKSETETRLPTYADPNVEKRNCKFELFDYQCPSVSRFDKIIVPLPVLEDCEVLHTIAVPFKVRPLRNVQTRRSAFVLEHYYTTVLKCLMSKGSSQKDIRNFNAHFHTWLVRQVFPHLADEQWYPAFGGVYRIIQTIKKLGADSGIREYGAHDIGFLFTKGFEFENAEQCPKIGKEKIRDVGEEFEEPGVEPKPRKYFIFAVAVLSIVWVCALCACISYCFAHRCWRRSSTPTPSQSSRFRDDDGLLNFHFLVKYGQVWSLSSLRCPQLTKKGLDSGNVNVEHGHDLSKGHRKSKNDGLNFKYDNGRRRKGSEDNVKKGEGASDQKKLNPNENVPISGAGDMGQLLTVGEMQSKEYFKASLPSVWPYQTSFTQFEKFATIEKPSKPPPDGDRELLSLWKKPSNTRPGKETNKKGSQDSCKGGRTRGVSSKQHLRGASSSTMQMCSSCDCTESSHSSSCFTSTSSSQNNVREPFAIDPKKVLKKAKGRRKTLRRRPVEVATDGSESGGVSSSSECNSTETTPN